MTIIYGIFWLALGMTIALVVLPLLGHLNKKLASKEKEGDAPEENPNNKKDDKKTNKKDEKKEGDDERKKRKLLILFLLVLGLGLLAIPLPLWTTVLGDWWWTKYLGLIVAIFVVYGFGTDWTEPLAKKLLARATFFVVIIALVALIWQKSGAPDLKTAVASGKVLKSSVASEIKSAVEQVKPARSQPKLSPEDEAWAKGKRFIAPTKGWITINCPRIKSWSIVALPPQANDKWEVAGEWGKYVGGGPGSEKKAGPPLMSGFKIRSHSDRDLPVLIKINFK